MSASDFSPAEPLTLAMLLIVSPDAELARALALSLLDEPYEIHVCSSAAAAKAELGAQPVDVVLVDQHIEDGADGELFAFLRARRPAIIRILLGREGGLHKARRAAQNSMAHHYLPITCDRGELALVLYNTLVQRSFLPPESDGILPIQSSRPPPSAVVPSRAPGIG